MLGPVLNLINGPVVADALRDPYNRLAKLSSTVKDDAKLVEEIFLAVLNRLPTPNEVEFGRKALKDGEADHAAALAAYEAKRKAFDEYERKSMPAKRRGRRA